jgi:hypothetical protein
MFWRSNRRVNWKKLYDKTQNNPKDVRFSDFLRLIEFSGLPSIDNQGVIASTRTRTSTVSSTFSQERMGRPNPRKCVSFSKW